MKRNAIETNGNLSDKIMKYSNIPHYNKRDQLYLVTPLVSTIYKMIDAIKDNVITNVKFNNRGMHLFSLYNSKTVCVQMTIGLSMFSEFKCDNEITTALNLSTLAKKLSAITKIKSKRLIFTICDGDISLKGECDSGPDINISFRSVNSEFDNLELDCKYNVPLVVNAVDFAKQIESMPSMFVISVDINKKVLIMEGDDNCTTTKVPMKISDDIVDQIRLHDDVKNYRASFLKSNLIPVLKLAKLTDCMILGLSSNAPLSVICTVSESYNQSRSEDSRIEMFISPRIDEDE